MPFAKGKPKTGGRRKGEPDLKIKALASCQQYRVNPFDLFAQSIDGQIRCSVCKGTGRAKYATQDGQKMEQRQCASCHGDGYEHLTPRDRLWAAAQLASRIEPELKAVEHTGPDGGPVQHAHTITFVE